MDYILVYANDIVIEGSITKCVGPFKTTQDAADWHEAKTPAAVGTVIDVIRKP